MPSSTLDSSASRHRGGGPAMRSPSAVNDPEWHGQTNLFSAPTQRTEHPRCGQIGDNMRNCPALDGNTYTAVCDEVVCHASRRSKVMVFATGAVSEAKSCTGPTSDHVVAVALLRSGYVTKRSRGRAKRALT